VSGDSNVGGLCGYGYNCIYTSCYFLDTAGLDNGYGEPLTDEQMKQQISFTSWDFTTPVWEICEGTNYPKLAWQEIIAGDFVCPDGVDIYDLMVFADQWLLEELNYDIYQNDNKHIVNLLDWNVFAAGWDGDKIQLRNFSGEWLKQSAYNADIAPAVGGDGIVNFLDFALFAENWLVEE
jgi:hypothetical protein